MRAIAVAILCCLAVGACRRSQEWESFGRTKKANLVVVFAQNTSNEQMTQFLDEKLSTKRSSGGQWHRPGIGAIIKTSADGHDAYAVTLEPTMTPVDRQLLKLDLESSASVLEVFEDVPPSEVKLAPGSD